VVTDGWGGYDPLRSTGYRHRPHTQGTLEGRPRFCRASIVSWNLKTWLRGTHHGVGHAHLQAYLDEFVFSVQSPANTDAAFQTLLGLGSQQHPRPQGSCTEWS